MPNIAIVVEGAHDASFLGQLLKRRGFSAVRKLADIPDDWRSLFPRMFPVDGENLERVMRFPEVHTLDDLAVGIMTAGSDSRVISTLRVVIDAIGTGSLAGIGLFVDTDSHGVAQRFAQIQKQLNALNAAATQANEPGYPIAVPSSPGTIEVADLPVGVFLFPDNQANGALENVLIACAQENHSEIAAASLALVSQLDHGCPQGQKDLKSLRAGMGMQKAAVGAIANVLKPGASVAASLAQTSWLEEPAAKHELVKGADEFLSALLQK